MTRIGLIRQRLGISPAQARVDAHFDRIIPIPDSASHSASARVPTTSGSRYLQQLCKHWTHNLAVTFTDEHGTITFPRDVRGADHPGDALVTLDAAADALEVRIDSTSDAQRDGLKDTVARHLDRFAFREAPLPFEWRDG